jgi:hypothetical protein
MMNATQQALVTSRQDIEMMLKHGLTPITRNEAALLELGFRRSYPGAASGYESTIWDRSVDRGYRQSERGLRRVMAVERAYLVDPA